MRVAYLWLALQCAYCRGAAVPALVTRRISYEEMYKETKRLTSLVVSIFTEIPQQDVLYIVATCATLL